MSRTAPGPGPTETDAVGTAESVGTGEPTTDGVDPISGLADRTALTRHGPAALARAVTRRQDLTLLVLDLDGFKQVNDTAGHPVGDRVLAETGRRIRRLAGPDDVLARMGGDEFAVLTVGSPAEARERARRLVDDLAVPFEVDDLVLQATASVGLAVHGHDAHTFDGLVRAADQAMYAAKAAGGGRWRASSPADEAFRRQAGRILADLREGGPTGAGVLEHLALHYQPQVDAATGLVVGEEALLRWEHPEFGLLTPDRFVPMAERSGLIGPITATVLDVALRDHARLNAAAPGSRLSVNATRRHILSRGLVGDLERRLDRYGVDPRSLVLEVTESLTSTTPETDAVFERLHRLGVGVSIRGFGTARSSLTGLWANPAVVEVKLARRVVRDTHSGEHARRLVTAATGAAHGLGLRAVAEGVERPADVTMVRTLGCDVLQGFLLAEPADVDSVVAWVRGWDARRVRWWPRR